MQEEIVEQEKKKEEEIVKVERKEPEEVQQRDWRDNVYGNVKMSVKTLDIVIGCMLGLILAVLAVGAIKLFL